MVTIVIDFDGTVVKHEYPKMGEDCPNAVKVLKRLTKDGHRLILFTMRSGDLLDDAVRWFRDREIPLFGIQGNPEQISWTTSPKPYADIIIDDTTLGAMLTKDLNINSRPYIDWERVDEFLKTRYKI